MMSITKLAEIGQMLYAHIAIWLHNRVSQLQVGKRNKNFLLIHEAVARLSKNYCFIDVWFHP